MLRCTLSLTRFIANSIFFVISYGLSFANEANLVPYAPYGVSGIFRGSATCFYAFIGFDVIATSAEETINPQVVVPRAMIASLSFSCVVYVAVSGVLTMMVPSSSLNSTAPLALAFVARGAKWAQYVIAPGAIAGLSTSLLNTLHPQPRILFAVCEDGLLPAWIGKISPRLQTPARATALCGLTAAVMAATFDVTTLAQMMSVGTLSGYALVSASVVVLRARAAEELEDEAGAGGLTGRRGGRRGAALIAEGLGIPLLQEEAAAGVWRAAGMRPSAAASVLLLCYSCGCAFSSVAVVLCGSGNLAGGKLAAVVVLFLAGIPLGVASAVALSRTPSQAPLQLSFHVPRGLSVALASIGINIFLLASLPPATWVRYLVWLFVGGLLYGGYGISHSKLGQLQPAADSSGEGDALNDDKGERVGKWPLRAGERFKLDDGAVLF